jgi:hypothetical protein
VFCGDLGASTGAEENTRPGPDDWVTLGDVLEKTEGGVVEWLKMLAMGVIVEERSLVGTKLGAELGVWRDPEA